ncbi:MAG: hypothetical protein IKD43_00870, partial [Clostridia bacterium]|nr:hypothetical protein [Clostridia bacterium]
MTKKTIKSVLATVMACGMVFAFAGCAHVHTFDESKWEYNATKHWNPSICEHEELGTIGKNSGVHTYAEGDTCDVCGYERDHVHRFDNTTWESDATNHWRPVTCGHTDAVEKIAHSWGNSYTNKGDQGHTRTCSSCSTESVVQAHVFDNDTDTSCNSRNCGYTRTVATPDPDPNPNPNPNPDPGPGGEQPGGTSGGVITNSTLADNHQGETSVEKDAKWARYDLYALSAAGSEAFASYVKVVDGVGANQNISTNRVNEEGYYPIGNMNKNTNLTVTYTIYASEACEVGIYGQFSNRAASGADIPFTEIFSLTVNNTVQPCTGVNLPQDGSNYAPTNNYLFLSYANLVKGENTVVLTVVMANTANNGYNFYGFRFSAETAQIGMEEFPSAPAAGASKLPDAHQGTQEKDASWARYTLPLRAEPGSNDLASYVVVAGATASVPSEGADEDGYNGVGGFRAAYGATITITVNASAACEAGLYFEMSARTSEVMMGSLFTLAVNGTAVDVSAVKLQTTEGTDN